MTTAGQEPAVSRIKECGEEIALAEIIQNYTGCADSDSIHAAYAVIAALSAERAPGGEVERGTFYVCPACHGIGNVTREVHDLYTHAPPAVPEPKPFACDGERYIPVSTAALRWLSDKRVLHSALGKFSPAVLEKVGLSHDERNAIEGLWSLCESFDFTAITGEGDKA